MRHSRWLATVAVLALLASACGVAAADGPLWSRGFEQGTGRMQAWYNVHDVGRTSTSPHSGDWALDVDGDDFWGIEETWPGQHEVTPGAKYEFSGWVKATVPQDVSVDALFVGPGGSLERVATVHVTSEWTQYSGILTAPADVNTVLFRYEGPSATRFYLDDVQASLVSGEPEPEPTETTQPPEPEPTETTEPDPTEDPTTPPAGNVCTDPDVVFEGWEAQGIGDYYADAGIWNDNGEITQTMGVCSHDSWYVDVAVGSNDPRAVLSYPNIHLDYHNWSTGEEPRLDSFASLTSSFAHQTPESGVWNVAYDVWINGVGHGPGTTELMVWLENSGQRPAGSQVGTVTVDGREWELWATSDDVIVSYVATESVASGELDLLAFTQHMMDTGRIAADSTIGQVGYGVEIVDTPGEIHFDFTDFSVSDS